MGRLVLESGSMRSKEVSRGRVTGGRSGRGMTWVVWRRGGGREGRKERGRRSGREEGDKWPNNLSFWRQEYHTISGNGSHTREHLSHLH